MIFGNDAMTTREILLPDLAATETLARRLAPLLRVGDVVALGGELGAGKTAFCRALIRTLHGSDIDVPSPTFTLVQMYDLPAFELWHFDLYRLETPQEAFELDIEDAFATGVSLIEWPARLGPYLPANRLDIGLTFDDAAAARRMSIAGSDDWECRLEAIRDD